MSSGVLFGGPSPEHDVSILTGLQALRELSRSEPDAVGLYWSKTAAWYMVTPSVEAEAFVDGVPREATELLLRLGDEGGFYGAGRRSRRLDVDAVVLATHGGPGEDGSLQGALDLAGVAYSGPGVDAAALGMDKWAFYSLLAAAGLPTLPRALLDGSTSDLPFASPYIVKPRYGGSSIGIDVVGDLATARARLRANTHLARGAIVEPFRADLADVQLAMRTYPTLELSAIERPLRGEGTEILNYRDKYVSGEGMIAAPRELPAALDPAQRDQINAVATEVARLAAVRGVARLDYLANDGELYVNEINTIPGSLSRYLFVDPLLDFATLLADLLREARERPAHRYSAAGADGTVLRSASSIAAKLA